MSKTFWQTRGAHAQVTDRLCNLLFNLGVIREGVELDDLIGYAVNMDNRGFK